MSVHLRSILMVIAVTYLLHVNADNQKVIDEINKLENMFNNFQTPPELLENVLKQVEHHCPDKKTPIDKSYLANAGKCLEQHINTTQIAEEMRLAVPEGKMDIVFRGLCFKWPKVRGCLGDFFDVVDECWNKKEKVTTFTEEIVRFFCGEDNEGEKIAIFFAEGGFDCLQTRGANFSECIQKKEDLIQLDGDLTNLDEIDLNEISSQKVNFKSDEVCSSIKGMHECASIELRHCKDPTTENLMSSMLLQVGKALECKTEEFKLHTSGASGVYSSALIILVTMCQFF